MAQPSLIVLKMIYFRIKFWREVLLNWQWFLRLKRSSVVENRKVFSGIKKRLTNKGGKWKDCLKRDRQETSGTGYESIYQTLIKIVCLIDGENWLRHYIWKNRDFSMLFRVFIFALSLKCKPCMVKNLQHTWNFNSQKISNVRFLKFKSCMIWSSNSTE